MTDIIYFWKPSEENGLLSNSSNHSILWNDMIFKTVEHYYAYQKALLMGDSSILDIIFNAETPEEAKRLVRSIKIFKRDLWDSMNKQIMFDALFLKANQHEDVKNFIKNTNNSLIVYSCPFDFVWGVGLTKENSKDQSTWNGENLLGKIWMEVRQKILDPSIIF